MELVPRKAEDLLVLLPQRLLEYGGLVGVDKYIFSSGIERGVTCVIAYKGFCTWVGIAVKSEHDKYNPEIGLRIALCRCLRSAGLLPKAKRQKRKRTVLVPKHALTPFGLTSVDALILGLKHLRGE